MGHAIKDMSCRWPNSIVYYSISPLLNAAQRTAVMRAIDEWNSRTMLEFRPTTFRRDRIEFVPGRNRCQSPVGRQGGVQKIECSFTNSSAFIHEIGHSVGLYHEHQRPERNEFVTIHIDNIREDRKHNFEIKIGENAYGDYDPTSIMHYDDAPFSADWLKDPTSPAITAKPGKVIAPSRVLSNMDIRTVELLYGRDKGALLWYSQGANSDTLVPKWDYDFGRCVGSGWDKFLFVFAPNRTFGAIYGVEKNGDLKWYRHLGASTGRPDWQVRRGRTVGTGWSRFRSVFASSSGVMYGVERNGDLSWYRHLAPGTGTARWARSTATKVGSGWNRFSRVIGSSNGTIYAMEPDGDLFWYRHTDFISGGPRWHPKSGSRVGTGWNRFRGVVADESNLYAIERSGVLQWYRHSGFNTGAPSWVRTTGTPVGTGWQIYSDFFTSGNGKLYGVVA